MLQQRFNQGDEQQEFKVFSIVKNVIEQNHNEDYYFINDETHDEVTKVFKYTHVLRKVYQEHIKFIFKKQNKIYPSVA